MRAEQINVPIDGATTASLSEIISVNDRVVRLSIWQDIFFDGPTDSAKQPVVCTLRAD